MKQFSILDIVITADITGFWMRQPASRDPVTRFIGDENAYIKYRDDMQALGYRILVGAGAEKNE